MTMTVDTLTPTANDQSSGGHLVTVDGKDIPLKATTLDTTAGAGVARTVVRQTFKNPYKEPLQVKYTLPLPADGAVGGFRFTINGDVVLGKIEERKKAREIYNEAILNGKTAGIIEQERSSVFTQELGNLPGEAELIAEITVDQKLKWLPDGLWEFRFPTVVCPRYMGETGRVPDVDNVTVDVNDTPPNISTGLSMSVTDTLMEGTPITSTSHSLVGTGNKVSLGEGAVLDRDVVVRWSVPRPVTGATLKTYRRKRPDGTDGVFGLLTVVPPEHGPEPVRRDLILLLDTSGSMGGNPINQAKAVSRKLIEALGDEDTLEMVTFASRPKRWVTEPVKMSEKAKAKALQWLDNEQAGGATEMRDGICEALKTKREDAQRQVVLITDGQIGFENEIVDEVQRRMPTMSRLHCLGVGSSVNRSLTAAAARAGRGVEVIIGYNESPEDGAKRLLAATRPPVLTALTVGCKKPTAPEKPGDVLSDQPVLISLDINPGESMVTVTGMTSRGAWSVTVDVPPTDDPTGEVIPRLYARERVEDLEAMASTGKDTDKDILTLGLHFGISTRLTSWVAVSEKTGVDPTEGFRRSTVPQQLPYGVDPSGLGLRGEMQTMGVLRGMSVNSSSLCIPDMATYSLSAPDMTKGTRSRSMSTSYTSSLKGASPTSFNLVPDSADFESTCSMDWSPEAEVKTSGGVIAVCGVAGSSPVLPAPPTVIRTFHGKILKKVTAGTEDVAYVSFEVGETGLWEPLTVEAWDGTTWVTATMEPKGTTKNTTLSVGMWGRILIRYPTGMSVTKIRVTMMDGTLVEVTLDL